MVFVLYITVISRGTHRTVRLAVFLFYLLDFFYLEKGETFLMVFESVERLLHNVHLSLLNLLSSANCQKLTSRVRGE